MPSRKPISAARREALRRLREKHGIGEYRAKSSSGRPVKGRSPRRANGSRHQLAVAAQSQPSLRYLGLPAPAISGDPTQYPSVP